MAGPTAHDQGGGPSHGCGERLHCDGRRRISGRGDLRRGGRFQARLDDMDHRGGGQARRGPLPHRDRPAQYRAVLQASLPSLRQLRAGRGQLRRARHHELARNPGIPGSHENRGTLRVPRPAHPAQAHHERLRRPVLPAGLLAILLRRTPRSEIPALHPQHRPFPEGFRRLPDADGLAPRHHQPDALAPLHLEARSPGPNPRPSDRCAEKHQTVAGAQSQGP